MLYIRLKAHRYEEVTDEHHEDPTYPWPFVETPKDPVLMGKLDGLEELVVFGFAELFRTDQMDFLKAIEEQWGWRQAFWAIEGASYGVSKQ